MKYYIPTLSADSTRCLGSETDGEWRIGCEDCLRMLSPAQLGQVFVEPPELSHGLCGWHLPALPVEE